MRIVDVETMQRLDKATIDSGIPGEVLMERAGRFVADEAKKILTKGKVLILAGGGNNGGDGFVAARVLHNAGFNVNVLCLSKEDKLSKDAMLNYYKMVDVGLSSYFIDEANGDLSSFFGFADLIIDSLLGTGTKGAPRGIYAKVIELANQSQKPIIAVDVPSGVIGDTGAVPCLAIKAAVTVTFGYPKIGHFVYPGREHTGELLVRDIGILPDLIDKEKQCLVLNTPEDINQLIPQRAKDGHKGTFGKGYILTGSRHFSGAAILTSLAFMRSGAGIAFVGMPQTIVPVVASRAIEAIPHPLPDVGRQGALSKRALGEIHKKLPDMNACIIGPGLGSHHETVETVVRLLQKIDLPTLVDADGLNALAKYDNPKIFGEIKAPTVFTPHPGELSRLLKTSIPEIAERRFYDAPIWAGKLNTVLVIKGSPTLIAEPDGRVFVNITGNDAMATAGSGDVLSGIIGGLLAQGLSPIDAARLGVFLHGTAGEIASQKHGNHATIASDILNSIGEAYLATINWNK